MRETKDFQFEVKELTEDGQFEGWLSVYGVKDLTNDIVEAGAFAKTIQERGGTVPCLWQHKSDEPIGTLELQDRSDGLWVKGKLLLEVQQAREAYALIKAGVIKGLSIGYEAVKKQMQEGIRHLKEIKLYEGSIVTFPALPLATISQVKGEQKDDFLTELDSVQTYYMRMLMLDAIRTALDDIAWDSDMTPEDKIAASGDSIQQFKDAYVAFLPKLLTLWGEMKSDAKSGRRISASTRTQIEEAISKLQALLQEEESTETEASAAEPPIEVAAEKTAPEPEADALHSWLKAFTEGCSLQ